MFPTQKPNKTEICPKLYKYRLIVNHLAPITENVVQSLLSAIKKPLNAALRFPKNPRSLRFPIPQFVFQKDAPSFFQRRSVFLRGNKHRQNTRWMEVFSMAGYFRLTGNSLQFCVGLKQVKLSSV